MMKLSRTAHARIENWIYRNGRPLEAARYDILFKGAAVEPFVDLLALYQNADGGFGHALEPDLWNPASTPYVTSSALGLLRSVDFVDYTHPVYQGALRYLESGHGFANGQWLFSLPENDAHPHAPWWSYSDETNRTESFGLTAELAAFVLDACPQHKPLYAAALNIARQTLERVMASGSQGEMGLGGCAALIHHWEALGMADMEAITARMKALVDRAIVRDPALWGNYVPRPSAAIFSPESPFYPGNEAAVSTELDYLIETLPNDDVWPINWRWFGMDQYADAFAISQNWWKAWKAIEKLQFLRAFGRVEA